MPNNLSRQEQILVNLGTQSANLNNLKELTEKEHGANKEFRESIDNVVTTLSKSVTCLLGKYDNEKERSEEQLDILKTVLKTTQVQSERLIKLEGATKRFESLEKPLAETIIAAQRFEKWEKRFINILCSFVIICTGAIGTLLYTYNEPIQIMYDAITTYKPPKDGRNKDNITKDKE